MLLFRFGSLWIGMNDGELLNERKCDECDQVTTTRHWQTVTFCANRGVEADSTGADRREHFSVGIPLSPDEVDRLIDGEEVSLSRAVSDDHHLTVNLMKCPPRGPIGQSEFRQLRQARHYPDTTRTTRMSPDHPRLACNSLNKNNCSDENSPV